MDCILITVKSNPGVSITSLINTVNEKYSYQVSYRKAWTGKQRALEKIFGGWIESYSTLPTWLNALIHTNPGTIVISDVGDYEERGADGFMHLSRTRQMLNRIFWAFKPSIDAFSHCRPLLQIDGTHLYGKFRGTLLIAGAIDGDNHMVPIAFAIVNRENNENWGWFLSCLKTHVVRRGGICVISDRHAGIIHAMNDQYLGWRPPFAEHRFCLRHFVANHFKQFKNTQLKNLLYHVGKQHQVRKFNNMMRSLCESSPETQTWLSRVEPCKWAQAHDGGCRFDNSTTNMLECVNGVLKGTRNLPITALIQSTFMKSVVLFNKHRTSLMSQLENGVQFTTFCRKKMEYRNNKATGHQVTIFDGHRLEFEVLTSYNAHRRKGGNNHTVHLMERLCSCGKFQSLRIPCSHAIAACMKMSIDPFHYVDNSYRVDVTLQVYGGSFHPYGHQDYWPQHEGLTWAPNPAMQRGKGRPKTSRIRNEMDWKEARKHSYICKKCKEPGHSSRTCKAVSRS